MIIGINYDDRIAVNGQFYTQSETGYQHPDSREAGGNYSIVLRPCDDNGVPIKGDTITLVFSDSKVCQKSDRASVLMKVIEHENS